MHRWLEDILNLLFPAECHLCGTSLVPGERFVCNPCLESLPRTGYHRTLRNPMEEKFAGQFPFYKATGHFFYTKDSSLSQLIQDMKYRNFPSIGDKMGEIAAQELFSSGFLNDIDVIVPLPMYFFKQIKRGYNQTEHLAKGMSKATSIPVVKALKMVHSRKSQTFLSRTERMDNARHLFSCVGKYDLNGKGVLLVDDICTTGATLGAAAKTLTDKFPRINLSLFTLGITF